MAFDLRVWLKEVEAMGQLQRVSGADWNLEIGAIAELVHKQLFEKGKVSPALLFDQIGHYSSGYQVLTGMLNSIERLAFSLNMDKKMDKISFVKQWQKKLKNRNFLQPKIVTDGPVLENIHTGEDINLFEFPTPKWHEFDGGRYIGTGSVTITQHPDEGWINMGTYRVMIHDENTLAFYITPGKHGMLHREAYFAKDKACPVAISFGQHPTLFFAACTEAPYSVNEYDIAGGILGEPVEVIKGPYTGLPVPANAEIVVEGESYPGDYRNEGPFGEWPGYYGSAARPEPIIRVKNILHRNNPIITGAPPSKPPNELSFPLAMVRAGMIWNDMEKAGVPGVEGVWCHEAGGHRQLIAISIKQKYAGHAKQAALIASQCHAGAYMGRYIVVVDEDVDPTSLQDVAWAVTTRTDPKSDIDIIRDCWSGPIDPMLMDNSDVNSRAIINACKPYHCRHTFPHVATTSKELKEHILAKWHQLFV